MTHSPLAAQVRGQDRRGAGHYKAPRGSRLHLGVDIRARVGQRVVTWLPRMMWVRNAWPYGKAAGLGGVALEDNVGCTWKVFYLEAIQYYPGEVLELGTPLGVVQSLQGRYPGITTHIHVQGRRRGRPFDPTLYLVAA